jgi:peptide-methionine (S)-S-oxide reductase
VIFDSDVVSFREILEVFFDVHNPTTLNQQGADLGSQYRSVIFYHDEKQKETAEQVIYELESKKIWQNPIVTQIAPYKSFHKAEEYHKRYYDRHPEAGYCRLVIAPKISMLRKKHAKKLKKL